MKCIVSENDPNIFLLIFMTCPRHHQDRRALGAGALKGHPRGYQGESWAVVMMNRNFSCTCDLHISAVPLLIRHVPSGCLADNSSFTEYCKSLFFFKNKLGFLRFLSSVKSVYILRIDDPSAKATGGSNNIFTNAHVAQLIFLVFFFCFEAFI